MRGDVSFFFPAFPAAFQFHWIVVGISTVGIEQFAGLVIKQVPVYKVEVGSQCKTFIAKWIHPSTGKLRRGRTTIYTVGFIVRVGCAFAILIGGIPQWRTVSRIYTGPFSQIPFIHIPSFFQAFQSLQFRFPSIKFGNPVSVESNVEVTGPLEFWGTDDICIKTDFEAFIIDGTYIFILSGVAWYIG